MDEQNLVTGGQTGLTEGDTVVTQDGQEFVKVAEGLAPVTEGKPEKPKNMTCKEWRIARATGKYYTPIPTEKGTPFQTSDGRTYDVMPDGSFRRRK